MNKENLENPEKADHFEEIFESTLDSVERIEDEIKTKLLALGFDEDGVMEFSLVVREAAVNAVKHGNQEDPSKKVTVEFDFDAGNGEATVTITDEGSGFDLEKVPDPTDEEGLLKTSGRGILLMKQLGRAEFLDGGRKVILHKSRKNKKDPQE